MKALRSLLFVPAHREGWAEKAIAAGADGLILDLEDSVPDHLKDEGRARAADTIARVRATGSDVGLYVRVNALDTGVTGDDIAAVAVPGLDGLFLPKLFGANDVVKVDALVSHFERHNGVEPGTIELICSLETAESYATCEQIATASPRVATLMAGTARDADVSRSLGFTFTPNGHETLYLRSRALLAARSNGLTHPLVGVWQDLQDPDGARAFSEQNREIGFRGQVLIHPSHIALANEVFSPSEFEISFYKGMIEAFDAAVADGRAAVTYEGMHVDYAHIKTAREVLAYAAEFSNSPA
ncbi:CoA ester lyase [Gordonia sp. zg691]|uniref:CoA ester lyase n=1 Tax=Gordonia jinghuaiqii TaxID=2758710 RepID=A0A7D7RQR0_9ACTN|nr:CoA ester lyase [Gordonia jinghuaiqii]MBD0863123.1 CoA ester lyase [Gordonia jinghuaiqii]MCR5980366.1 CoA ester lyase [Gordonia jinghuaiqii]QMT01893.1 CoA ester lyase [Gordonia jinghuaiqii]